jgi:hypothetical protein
MTAAQNRSDATNKNLKYLSRMMRVRQTTAMFP